MLIYVNMNMKKTWKSYDARLCKIGVEQTKWNEGLTSIYTPMGT